jgi:hypothetical protein
MLPKSASRWLLTLLYAFVAKSANFPESKPHALCMQSCE